jgi:hypothetical protein
MQDCTNIFVYQTTTTTLNIIATAAAPTAVVRVLPENTTVQFSHILCFEKLAV